MATISGGADIVGLCEIAVSDGKGMLISGFANSASTDAACAVVEFKARRFKGRLERGSADVGMDSGIGSDMLEFRPGFLRSV